jgi:ABC-type phosphate transport system auxiliary subunit
MIWIFILLAGLAACFIKLGMYSVWVTILLGAVKISLVVIIGLLIGLVWRKVFKKNN